MIVTTLERIQSHSLCLEWWDKLLKGLGKTIPDNDPLPFARIVEIIGLSGALWCCRAEPQYDKAWRLFAVFCARQEQHLMTDQRSISALDVAEAYANGLATDYELGAAWVKALAATRDMAWDVEWITKRCATQDEAVHYAARNAAWFATCAVAKSAAQSVEWFVTDELEHPVQKKEFLRIVTTEPEQTVQEKKFLRFVD